MHRCRKQVPNGPKMAPFKSGFFPVECNPSFLYEEQRVLVVGSGFRASTSVERYWACSERNEFRSPLGMVAAAWPLKEP
jgi:hypothetical protein